MRISTRKILIYKTLAPFLLFAFCVFASASTFLDGTLEPTLLALSGYGVASAFVGYLGWLATRDLADEVNDCGGHLLVRRGRQTASIAIADIMNVQVSSWATGISKITLRLAKPSALGSTISFLPVARPGLDLSEENEVAEALLNRAHAENAKRGV